MSGKTLFGCMTIIIILAFNQAFAAIKPIKIIKITNDEDRETSFMYVKIDKDFNITRFGYETFLDGQVVESKEFSNDLSYAGIVLEKQQGRDIIILRGLNVDYRHGGSLEIDFLFNGITGSRGKYLIELDRTSDAWQITKDGRIIRHLHMVSHRKPVVGTIGIKKINIVE